MARRVDILWPAAGLDRQFSYRQQPPYSTPDALNVRPADVFESRRRGGSRPGLGKAFYEELGSGAPVRLLSDISFLDDSGLEFWTDEFQGAEMGSAWTIASWMGALPAILPDDVASVSYTEKAGAVRSALDSIDTSKAYEIEIFISPYAGAHWGTYSLFARMDDTTPAGETDGAVAALSVTGEMGVFSGSLKIYVSGVATTYAFTGGTTGHAEAGWFKMLVTDNNVKCYWLGNLLVSQDVSAAAGSRVGFGLETTEDGGICAVESFRAQWFKTGTHEARRNMLVASAGGVLYRELTPGTLSALTTDLTLASDRQLMAVEHLQKLYIADHGDPRVTGTDGTCAGTSLDAASVSDWTAHSIDAHDDVVVISDGTGTVVDGTYKISTVAAGNLTLSSSAGTGNCTFRVERAPKVYDPVADTLGIWTATAGQVPSGCPIVARYRDRLVLVKDNVWYMSRSGDALDWDYGADASDVLRAVAGTSATAGQVGEIHTAAIAHSDDYLVFGCERSTWVLRGDPAFGGQLDNLSREVGIIGKLACCHGPEGETYFLGSAGLFVLAPGAGTPPAQLSAKLPREMQNVSPVTHDVSMAYDCAEGGLHIFLVGKTANGRLHFWFDLADKSPWPVRLQDDHEPCTALAHFGQDPADNAVLLGCRDGYIRRFHPSQETDEGTEIGSYVVIGPIRAAGNDLEEGLIMEVIGALGRQSGDVDWSITPGATHEAAVYGTAQDSGTWEAGANYSSRPNTRAGSFCLKLSNGEDNRAWALERVNLVLRTAGRQRLP